MRIYDNDPLAVREYTLNNGMQVITSVNKAEPRIYSMVAVKTGSKNDPSTNTGLAHYLEHMLFKGTDKYGTLDWEKEKEQLSKIDALYEIYNKTTDDTRRKELYRQIDSVSQLAAKFSIANEYDKMCQAMGASGTNAFTSNEQTVYINDVPSNMLHKWLELEAERYRNPILRLFHTELEAVYEEKNIGMDNDNNKVWEALYAKLFENHNYGKQTTIGTVEHLKNPSLLAIREYYNKYYVPNNMAIILSGDFDPDAAADGVAEHFKYMGTKAIDSYTFEPEQPHANPRKLDIYGPDAAFVTVGYRLPGANSREALIAKLIQLILNNSSAGLIDINLVQEQKVLSANVYLDILNDYSAFVLTGKPREGQTLEEVRELLTDQMKLVMEGKFDDDLIKSILLNEEISKIREFKSNETRCGFLLESYVNGAGYQKHYNELFEMQKIRKEEIMELAKEFLNQDRVEVYKREGKDSGIQKIEKPLIHPVELNRDKQSEFVTEWLEEEATPIQPVFADFKNKIQNKDFDGLQIHYVKNKENRLFQLEYRYEYGRFHNKSLPLAMAYINLIGTSEWTAADISKKMYALGCSFNAYCGDKNSYLTLSGPEENFEKALQIFESLINHPKSDEVAFKNLIENEIKSRNDAKLNNRIIASRLSQYALYGTANPSKWILNSEELKKLSAEELIKIITSLSGIKHSVNYYGQRAFAFLERSINEQHLFSRTLKSPVAVEFIPRTTDQNEVYFVNYDMVQANIFWTGKSNNFDIRESAKIMAFNQYFGGDMSSVVFQNIRESKALAYSTYAYYNQARYADKPNSIIAFIGTQADKFSDAVAAMNELMQQLPEDSNVFVLSLESLKNQLETKRVLDEELTAYYFQMKNLGLDSDINEIIYRELPGIDLAAVAAFHKSRMAGRVFSYGVLGNKEKISNASLQKLGKVTTLNLEDIFGY